MVGHSTKAENAKKSAGFKGPGAREVPGSSKKSKLAVKLSHLRSELGLIVAELVDRAGRRNRAKDSRRHASKLWRRWCGGG